MATPNQYGNVNSSAPATTTGQLRTGNTVSPRSMQGASAGMTRNWGANNRPPDSGGIAKYIAQTLDREMRYGRNPFQKNSGRRTSRSGGGVSTDAAGNPTVEGGSGNVTVNFDGPTFGDQSYLGSTIEGNAPMQSPAQGRTTSGGTRFGDQSFLGSTTGGAGAVAGGGEFSQPQTRTRKELTPEQRKRNAETAKARRDLAADIKKNGTEEQKKRVEEEGVSGGKKPGRQPRVKPGQMPEASSTAAAPATRTIDARTIQANQSDASQSTVNNGVRSTSTPAEGGPGGAGASFIGSGAVTGSQVTLGAGGPEVKGGNIGKNELTS